MEKGYTSKCQCQKKYRDKRATNLGQRYAAMVQRCRKDTHVSSHNYYGRGIQVLFKSREHFIRWALEKYPNVDLKGLDFDRIDNEGHYSPDNLRLVDRTTNLLNTRTTKGINVGHARDFLKRNPNVIFTERKILSMLKNGYKEQEILEYHEKSVYVKRKMATAGQRCMTS
jgi:hypothetical protein